MKIGISLIIGGNLLSMVDYLQARLIHPCADLNSCVEFNLIEFCVSKHDLYRHHDNILLCHELISCLKDWGLRYSAVKYLSDDNIIDKGPTVKDLFN